MKYSPAVLLIILCSCDAIDQSKLTEKEFLEIVNTIEKGWNEGNAKLAVQFFSDDAVYEEPPKKQFYHGKNEIYNFFGGEKGYELPMKMKWHNLSFNEKEQIGFGEYTFSMNNQYHGIVAIKFEHKKILRWREYQYKSDLSWKEFTGESHFESRGQN
jgi:hypothetical protein